MPRRFGSESVPSALLQNLRHNKVLHERVIVLSLLTEDTGRAIRRIKALYRSQAIACAGKKCLGKRHRAEWMERLSDGDLRVIARVTGAASHDLGYEWP